MQAKRTAIVLVSALLASIAALGATAIDPQPAQAAGGGYVEKCGGGEIFLNEQEERTFALHNQARAEHDLQPFCVHPKLQKAARAHSQEMLDKDYAAHESFNGETVKQRLRRFGYGFSRYSYYAYGENIAWGSGPQASPESAFDFWMNSPNHRPNILSEKLRQVGIGARTGTFKAYGESTTYTVDFGVRRR
jgi:uncharacterized protein YkwD